MFTFEQWHCFLIELLVKRINSQSWPWHSSGWQKSEKQNREMRTERNNPLLQIYQLDLRQRVIVEEQESNRAVSKQYVRRIHLLLHHEWMSFTCMITRSPTKKVNDQDDCSALFIFFLLSPFLCRVGWSRENMSMWKLILFKCQENGKWTEKHFRLRMCACAKEDKVDVVEREERYDISTEIKQRGCWP